MGRAFLFCAAALLIACGSSTVTSSGGNGSSGGNNSGGHSAGAGHAGGDHAGGQNAGGDNNGGLGGGGIGGQGGAGPDPDQPDNDALAMCGMAACADGTAQRIEGNNPASMNNIECIVTGMRDRTPGLYNVQLNHTWTNGSQTWAHTYFITPRRRGRDRCPRNRLYPRPQRRRRQH